MLVDAEYDLDVPPDMRLKSVAISLDVVPPDAKILIFGWAQNETLTRVEVSGCHDRLILGFIHGHIAIKAAKGVISVIVSTLGYEPEHHRKGFKPPAALIGRSRARQIAPLATKSVHK